MPKIRITLEGSEQVVAQLNALGQAGANAVNKIQNAAARGVGFEDVGRASQAAATGFGRVGQAAEQAAAGFALSRREIAALRTAFRQLDLGAIGGQFAAFARVGAVFGPAAAAISGIGAAALTAAAAFTKFAKSAAETADELTKVQDVSGQTFENLSGLQQVFATGGASVKEFGQTFTELFRGISEDAKTANEDVADSAAKTAKAEADAFRLRLQTGKAVGAQNEAILRQLDKRAAKAQAEAEQNKALQQQANNLKDVVNQFERLARGEQLALDPLTTMPTAVKALSNALADVGKKGGDQFRSLANIIRGLPIEQARQLQQALKIPDAVFDVLRKGGQSFDEMRKKVEALGLTLTAVDQQNLKAFTAAWNDMVATIAAAAQKIGAGFAPQLIQGLNAIKQSALDLAKLPIGENLMHSLQGIGAVLKQVFVDSWVAIGSSAAGSFMTNFIGPIVEAVRNLGGMIGSAASGIAESFVTNFINPIVQAFDTIVTAAQSAFSSVTEAISGAVSAVANFVNQLGSIAWDTISGLGVAAWDAITGAIGRAIDAIQRFLGLKSSAGSGGGGDTGVPMASGGLFGGRGTGTSDSNLAWISRGEYITPARAVRQPGVLAFLEALRRSGGNLRSVLDGMGHFARGGLMLPAFAAGGLNTGASSSRTLHLTIGNETFRNLSVPESTALSLERFAVHSQIASTGRKPSWKR